MKFGIRLYSPIVFTSEQDKIYNILNVSITRFNIGYIIGTVLSWVSIFALICSFMIGPLMDYKHSLLQAETIFFIKPELRRPNLLKFIIASYKSGIFTKEDHFVKLAEKT
jgi:hypothetical protein